MTWSGLIHNLPSMQHRIACKLAPPTFHRLVSHLNGVRKPKYSRRNFGCLRPQNIQRRLCHTLASGATMNAGGECAHVDLEFKWHQYFSSSKTNTAMAIPAVPLLPALKLADLWILVEWRKITVCWRYGIWYAGCSYANNGYQASPMCIKATYYYENT